MLQGCVNMLVMKNTCNFCYNTSKKLLDCGGKCGGGASYCNKTCQTKDWKEHQKICKKGKYGWYIQKLHGTMHVVGDISRFGVAPNFDAGIGKSLLQHFAKHPGSTTKCVAQIQFQESIAIRHREHETMPLWEIPLPLGIIPGSFAIAPMTSVAQNLSSEQNYQQQKFRS